MTTTWVEQGFGNEFKFSTESGHSLGSLRIPQSNWRRINELTLRYDPLELVLENGTYQISVPIRMASMLSSHEFPMKLSLGGEEVARIDFPGAMSTELFDLHYEARVIRVQDKGFWKVAHKLTEKGKQIGVITRAGWFSSKTKIEIDDSLPLHVQLLAFAATRVPLDLKM